jgi:hypothetical protein
MKIEKVNKLRKKLTKQINKLNGVRRKKKKK